MKNYLIFAIAIFISGYAGYSLQSYFYTPERAESVDVKSTEFAMLDLDGKMRNIREWRGKVVLLNFWATWCPPCKEEIPAFIELQKEYGDRGLQVVGVAVDDEDAVRKFAGQLGINYPVMASEDGTIELAHRYGNKEEVLPYSVFIDKDGNISYTIKGEVSKKDALKLLKDTGLGI